LVLRQGLICVTHELTVLTGSQLAGPD
jgi:hypothetical protein